MRFQVRAHRIAFGAVRQLLSRVIGRSCRARETLPGIRPRVVVDTNVLMGGLIATRKASGRVLGLWLDGRVEAVLSPAVREEYQKIFRRMRFGPRRDVARREAMLKRLLASEHVREVHPTRRLDVVAACPADNRLIECAVTGRARYVISQDHHLLDVGEFEGVEMVTARDFLAREFPGEEDPRVAR